MFTVLRWAVVLLLFAYILWLLYSNWAELQTTPLTFRPALLCVSILIYSIHLFLTAFLWHLLTVFNRSAIGLGMGIRAWLYSMLGKYVPGKVFLWAGRVYYYKRAGYSVKRITFCFALEVALQLLAAAGIILLAMFWSGLGPMFHAYRLGVVVIIVFLVMGINPRILEILINTGLKMFGRETIALELRHHQIVLLLAGHIVNGLLLGAGFFLFVNSVTPVTVEHYLFLTASFLLAGWIGIFSLLAPGGLGVRDTILLVVLRLIMIDALAAGITLAARLWTTMGELICVALVFIGERLAGGSPSGEPAPDRGEGGDEHPGGS